MPFPADAVSDWEITPSMVPVPEVVRTGKSRSAEIVIPVEYLFRTVRKPIVTFLIRSDDSCELN